MTWLKDNSIKLWNYKTVKEHIQKVIYVKSEQLWKIYLQKVINKKQLITHSLDADKLICPHQVGKINTEDITTENI